jgi:hypothetical protein
VRYDNDNAALFAAISVLALILIVAAAAAQADVG